MICCLRLSKHHLHPLGSIPPISGKCLIVQFHMLLVSYLHIILRRFCSTCRSSEEFMLTHGCIRFPVYAADISPRIQFQEQNNDAALYNMSNDRSRHHNFSAEELLHHPFALLAGRVFRVTFRGTLSSPNHRFHFSAQHLYAILKICLVSIVFRPRFSFSSTVWPFVTKFRLLISCSTTSAPTHLC